MTTTGNTMVTYIDTDATFEALAANKHDHDGMLKLPQDLDRYWHIIEITQPEVIVETGTRTGATANWFAAQGPEVITIDIGQSPLAVPCSPKVIRVIHDSIHPDAVACITGLVRGRRCMVSLDAAHDAAHVTAEIDAYGPLVSPGCYLVVEDGIWGFADETRRQEHGEAGMKGSPLDAITMRLFGNPNWVRDNEIEQLYPVSHNPAGWWQRAAVTWR